MADAAIWASKEGWARNHNDIDWEETFDFPGGKRSWRKFVSRGDDGTPEIFIITQDAGLVNARHTHSEGEVQFIIEGSLVLDGKEWGPGTFFHQPKMQPYGPLTAGPNGVTYLNIRALPADAKDRARPAAPGRDTVVRTDIKAKG
jgi:hypothetical protein